jgi:tetratricopeptide (TPR) repeat protein
MLCLLVGCSQEYMAERMCWYANKLYSQIVNNPKKASEQKIRITIDAFQEILETYPDWKDASQLQFAIAHIYFVTGKYPEARREFKKLQEKYSEQIGMCLQAEVYIGWSYERENNWDKALEYYQRVITDYPVSYPALKLLLYIAEYYEVSGNEDKAKEIYSQAIAHYKRIIRNYPRTQLEMVAWEFILTVYKKQRKYIQVLNALESLVAMHPESNRAAVAMYEIATLYQNVLKKPEEAFRYYKRFIKEYPEHELVKAAKTQMNSLALVIPKLKDLE